MRQLSHSSRMLYRSTLRVFLILLHDFPDFLCGYHLSLVNLLPSTCIQLRNLILSAFPPEMRLPDPFTSNLKMDSLPEMKQHPHLLFDYTQILSSNNIKQELDSCIKSRSSPPSSLKIGSSFLSKNPSSGSKFDVMIMNAVVLYMGLLLSGSPEGNITLALEIFQQVLSDIDSEGKNFFFSQFILRSIYFVWMYSKSASIS